MANIRGILQSYVKISGGTQSLAKLCSCFDIKWCGDIKAIEYCANKCMNDIAIDSNLLYTIFQ